MRLNPQIIQLWGVFPDGAATQASLLPAISQGTAAPHKLLLLHRAGQGITLLSHAGWKNEQRKIDKAEQLAVVWLALTSGGAGDAAAALAEAGAVHHHPALVWLLPGLSHHIGRPSRVVVASLGCEGKSSSEPFPQRRQGPQALTALREKEGAATHPQACRSTRPCRCPGTRTPACSRPFRGAGAMYRRSCRTGRPHGSDLGWETGAEVRDTPWWQQGKGQLARGKWGQLG